MALPVGGRFHVETAAGVAVSGGKVRIYNANTTTLASVYSDAALTVPLTNPVVAASDGWTAQVFAAEGLTVDIDFLTAADVVISGQSLVDAEFVGSGDGNITRDFINSRFQVRGSGGTVYVEAGPPSGDDIGGTVQIGGWDGTDADAITMNGPTNVDGALTVGGKPITGVVYTDKTAFSAASTVDITLPNSPAGCRAWRVDVYDVTLSADLTITGRLSFDNGATYNSGGTTYQSDGAASTSSMALAGASLDQQSGQGVWLRIEILTFNTASSLSTLVVGTVHGYDASTGQPKTWNFTNYANGGLGKATNLRLIATGGTITGSYRVTTLQDFD